MSMWSDNPEWFDDWIFEKALDGHFGKVIQLLAETMRSKVPIYGVSIKTASSHRKSAQRFAKGAWTDVN